jgi:hypothetical protein
MIIHFISVLSKKVECLYGGEKIDREVYLLGKPIDKLITESKKNEAASQEENQEVLMKEVTILMIMILKSKL